SARIAELCVRACSQQPGKAVSRKGALRRRENFPVDSLCLLCLAGSRQDEEQGRVTLSHPILVSTVFRRVGGQLLAQSYRLAVGLLRFLGTGSSPLLVAQVMVDYGHARSGLRMQFDGLGARGGGQVPAAHLQERFTDSSVNLGQLWPCVGSRQLEGPREVGLGL